MKRTRNDGASAAGALDNFSSNPFAHIPVDVMPNIWSRLPEEALGALLCTAKYFSQLDGMKEARCLERKVVLTLRDKPEHANLGVLNRYREMVNRYLDVIDVCMNAKVAAHIRNRGLDLIVGRKHMWDVADDSLFHKWAKCLRTLSRESRNRLLEKMLCNGDPLKKLNPTMAAPEFLPCFGDMEVDPEGTFQAICEISLTPGIAAILKMAFLFRKLKGSWGDPDSAFAEISAFFNNGKLQDAEFAEALSWLMPLHCTRYDSDDPPFDAMHRRLLEFYFLQCAKLTPEQAAATYAAGMQRYCPLWGSDRIKIEMATAAMNHLLGVEDHALASGVRGLIHECIGWLEQPCEPALALCERIQRSTITDKAALMIEVLATVAFRLAERTEAATCFEFAPEDNDDAIAFRQMFAMCQALPSEAVTAEALAMLACVVAYLPDSEMQAGAVDRMIALLNVKSPLEILPALALLAHLSLLLNKSSSEKLLNALHSAKARLPDGQGEPFLAALRDTRLRQFSASYQALSLKSLFLWLFNPLNTFASSRSCAHEPLVRKLLIDMVKQSLQSQFIGMFFAQISALSSPFQKSIAKVLGGEKLAGLSRRAEGTEGEIPAFDKLLVEACRQSGNLPSVARTPLLQSFVCHPNVVVAAHAVEAVLALPDTGSKSHISFGKGVHGEPLHQIATALGSNATSLLDEFKMDIPDDKLVRMKLLRHWKPLLRNLTPGERFQVLKPFAMFYGQASIPMSAVDLEFFNTMIEMASLLRDGDKPYFLNELFFAACMPACQESQMLVTRVRNIASKMPDEFAKQIDLDEISGETAAKKVSHLHWLLNALHLAAQYCRSLNEANLNVIDAILQAEAKQRDALDLSMPQEHWQVVYGAIFDGHSSSIALKKLVRDVRPHEFGALISTLGMTLKALGYDIPADNLPLPSSTS